MIGRIDPLQMAGSETEELGLSGPTHGQIDAARQSSHRQIGRLATGQDRFDDVRLQEGEGKKAADVFRMDAEAFGDLPATEAFTIAQRIAIGMRPITNRVRQHVVEGLPVPTRVGALRRP